MVAASQRRRAPTPLAGAGRSPRGAAESPVGSLVVGRDGRTIPRETLERLERLDDTVFAALAGDPQALDAAAAAWTDARRSVDGRLLDEARQHYLRRAESRWQRVRRHPAERLTLGFAAQEILGLFGD